MPVPWRKRVANVSFWPLVSNVPLVTVTLPRVVDLVAARAAELGRPAIDGQAALADRMHIVRQALLVLARMTVPLLTVTARLLLSVVPLNVSVLLPILVRA